MKTLAHSQSLIEKAKSIYVEASIDRRDAMLQLGRVAEQYVIACMEERRLTSRAVPPDRLARELEVTPKWANGIIKAVFVVDLIGKGVDLGKLTINSLVYMGRFIERGPDREWRVKPEYEKPSRLFIQRAVKENWSVRTVRLELHRVTGYWARPEPETPAPPKNSPRPHLTPDHPSKVDNDQRRHNASEARAVHSTDDAIDLCLKIVNGTPKPVETARKLIASLKTIK